MIYVLFCFASNMSSNVSIIVINIPAMMLSVKIVLSIAMNFLSKMVLLRTSKSVVHKRLFT